MALVQPVSAAGRYARSKLTNGTTVLAGVDGRTLWARRFRELVQAYSADLGGYDRLGEADRSLVKQAACTTVRAEQLQTAIAREEAVDADELIRLANTLRRLMSLLAQRRPAKPSTGHAVRDYLETRRAAAG